MEFRTILKNLLDGLDEISSAHEEVGDTEVRDRMSAAIQDFFIDPVENGEWPTRYGMTNPAADSLVRKTLQTFVAKASEPCRSAQGDSPGARLARFQDEEVESSEGSFYDDYFGYQEPS